MYKMDRRNKVDYLKPSKIKIKGIKDNKCFMRVHPLNAPFGIFGLNTVPKKTSKAIVITEGEYDAISVH